MLRTLGLSLAALSAAALAAPAAVAQGETLRERLEARQADPSLNPDGSAVPAADGSGLTLGEWIAAVNAVYRQLDLDRDGLTEEELNQVLGAGAAVRAEGAERVAGRNAIRAARGQEEIDTSGAPSTAEVQAAVQENFDYIDVNNDGRIGPVEFNVRLAPLFGCLDTNNDAVVTRSELQQVASMGC